MALSDLLRSGRLPWFGAGGRDGDVVLSSRVRLARNLVQLPFPNRADHAQLSEIRRTVDAALASVTADTGFVFERVEIDRLTELERAVLIEKRLISEKFAEAQPYRTAYIGDDTSASILVNEDDHVRIQTMAPGLGLTQAFEAASKIDDCIEAQLDLAFDETMGYLTAYPTNLGTGLRASVLLHLPGLVYTRNIDNIVNTSLQLGLAMQPLEGGGEAAHLYKISNQLTLGYSESEIIENVRSAAGEITGHERRARKALSYFGKDGVEDVVWRAYGILAYARSLTEQEVFDLASRVRFGIDRGIITGVSPDCYAEILVSTRDAYLRNLTENENLAQNELNGVRATRVREILDAYRIRG
jgi:hypothetical protein